jgi:S-formylglutathione hydrolase FrmB
MMLACWVSALRAEPTVGAALPSPGLDGVRTHELNSPDQAGATKVRVWLPGFLAADCRYPVVYVLPVEALDERRYGDGLLEVKKVAQERKFAAIFAAPTFSQLPWYADHPTDETIRQETYFLQAVMPLVEKNYPALPGREGRVLLGFSKSGWGAWSLLLRHPDRFERAAAWDAPLDMRQPNRYGMGPIFGTQANFERYQITQLLVERAASLPGKPRLGLFGYGNFRDQHEAVEQELRNLGIPHFYRDGPHRAHTWDSGWLPEAIEFLLGKEQPE